jgi:hypothetical protein
MRNPTDEYDRLHDHCQALARERDFLRRELDKWRNLAGNLYDEMRVRGAECLFRHEDDTQDCVKDFEIADELLSK